MLPIMKKDSKYYLLSICCIYPLIFLLWKISGRPFDVLLFILLNGLLFLLLTGAILASEYDEDRMYGYVILATLPIKSIEIVTAKYLLGLVSVTLLTFVNLSVFKFLASPLLFSLAGKLSIIYSMFCLLYSTFLFLGIYILGFIQFFRIGSSLLGLFILLIALLFQSFLSKPGNLNLQLVDIGQIINNLPLVYILVGGLLLYFMFFLLTVKVKDLKKV